MYCNFSFFLENDPLIDGRHYSELFQEVNPDLTVENVECGQKDGNSNLESYPLGSSYLCSFCNINLPSLDDLNRHTAEGHRDLMGALDQSPVNEKPGILNLDVPILCGICNTGFDNFSLLSSHVSQHEEVSMGKLESGNPFPCEFCPSGSTNFVDIDDLIKHTKAHHSKEADQSATCPDCSRKFKNLRALKVHIITHSSIRPFKCGGCHGCYSSTAALKIHFKNYCGANKAPMSTGARCQLARQARQPRKTPVIPTDQNLNDEEKKANSSAGEKGRRFTCQECGIVFKSRDLIQLHVLKCPAVKSKMLLQEAQLHLQGVKEKSFINLPNSLSKSKQQIPMFDAVGNDDLSATMEAPQEDAMSSEEESSNTPQTFSNSFTKFLTGKRGRPKKKKAPVLDSAISPYICNECGKCFKKYGSLSVHKCKPKNVHTVENEETLDDENVKPTFERGNKTRILKSDSNGIGREPKVESCLNDDYEWETKDQSETPIPRAGSETTRSGRLIKRKRIFEPEPEIKKRLRRSFQSRGRSSELERAGRVVGPTRASTACQACAEDLGSHMELFRHFITHLEPGVVKTLPVYEDGDTGKYS